MNVKIKTLTKANLIGEQVPTNIDGHAGRAVEQLLRDRGYYVQTGPGCDIPMLNGIEVKSREVSATSPQTVATMCPEDIKTTPYKKSLVYEKIQLQYRVKIRDGVIVKNDLYDFTGKQIQELLEYAYETARLKLVNGDNNSYIYGSEYGYFERTNKSSDSYSFRIHAGAMDKLEAMAKSTFNKIFEY